MDRGACSSDLAGVIFENEVNKMSIEEMRGEIALAYTGEKWKARVSRMGDSQVFAVYTRLSQTGKLEEAAKERETRKHRPPLVRYEQMRMDI